jgi:signal transduction histidine kinase
MSADRTLEQPYTRAPAKRGSVLANIRRILAAPVFENDEEKTRVASLLNAVLLILLVTTVGGTAAVIAVEPPSEWAFSLVFGVIMTAIVLGLQFFLRRGHVQVIGGLLALAVWAGITLILYTSGGIGNITITTYLLLIAITGLLLGERFGILFGFLSALASVGLFYADVRAGTPTEPAQLVVLLTAIVLMTLLVRFVVRTIAQGLRRARHNERMLAERNRELEASQRVTFSASERVSPDELLGLVVDLMRDQFHLYHVQVYIVDEERQAAVLRESTGYAGHQLLQREHRISLDQTALVTKAIREGKPVLVADVSKDPNFLRNPLLPETQSELVVPLKIGGQVIGVLDAQDRTRGRFAESTVTLFQTMADQIAFLFENSELLERVSEQTEALTIFTNQLRTAADIAQRLGTVLDPDRLLQRVVELIQSRFGLYHAHVYVLDASPTSPSQAGEIRGEMQLVVRAGSGEVGRVLRERGHSVMLNAEKSLVARAARTRRIKLIADASLESNFVPTPLLPQTRSEVAVPLVSGDELLGVLDLQDNQPGRFTQTDLDVFSTLAGHVATALQNAHLFEEFQEITDRLREANQLKSDFLSIMDRELRTPLNAISGYAELQLTGDTHKLDPVLFKTIWAIFNNSQRMIRTINNVLDIARIESGQMQLNLESIQIKSSLEEIRSSTAELLADKPVDLLIEIEEGLPPIQGDRVRLNQILDNIVSNAVKFTEQGSIALRAFGDDGWLCIEVEDTGIGIAEDDLEEIFERYKQVKDSTVRRSAGTGLGLAIARHLVLMHGGEINVRSQPGQGSTFTVRLPVRRQASEGIVGREN